MKLLRWLFGTERADLEVGRLFFFDESGINLSMTRAYARSAQGQRAIGSVPKNWGESVTLAAGIGLRGLIAPLMLRGSMTGEVFERYIEQFVLPELQPGDVVLWDNLGAHRRTQVAKLLADKGVRIIFLPPYSPDLNPIELAWSKAKMILRSRAARTLAELEEGVVDALRAISPADITAWFGHCGYR